MPILEYAAINFSPAEALVRSPLTPPLSRMCQKLALEKASLANLCSEYYFILHNNIFGIHKKFGFSFQNSHLLKQKKMVEAISGILSAIVIIILSRVLSKYFTVKLFAATILVAIAFIYVGFSLKNNPVNLIAIEISVALILYFMAIIGYTRNSSLIAYGIILHGVWDIFHHKGFLIGTDVPYYWPSFCFIIDIIDGIYFLIIFKRQKSINPIS